MTELLLDDVRDKCRWVAGQAGFVEIDIESLPGYAALLPPERLLLPEMDPAIHYLGHGADTVAYFLTLDAVNFGSGYFPEILGDPRRSGYRYIAAALTKHFIENGPIPGDKLSNLTASDCAGIFLLDQSNPAALELSGLYAQALNDVGAFVCDRFGGDFLRVVAEAGNSAERLVEILTAMPFFNDTAE